MSRAKVAGRGPGRNDASWSKLTTVSGSSAAVVALLATVPQLACDTSKRDALVSTELAIGRIGSLLWSIGPRYGVVRVSGVRTSRAVRLRFMSRSGALSASICVQRAAHKQAKLVR